jgi:hypothetical protein
LETWIKVPRSAARGRLVHKVKIVFKVKADGQKRFDKRKARLVIVGTRFRQYIDYLEHFTVGASIGSLKMIAIYGKAMGWIRFKADIANAFPNEKVNAEVFFELPKGPFDWRDSITGEE